jgi:hypothetical protein
MTSFLEKQAADFENWYDRCNDMRQRNEIVDISKPQLPYMMFMQIILDDNVSWFQAIYNDKEWHNEYHHCLENKWLIPILEKIGAEKIMTWMKTQILM